jgi:hypothetical protein
VLLLAGIADDSRGAGVRRQPSLRGYLSRTCQHLAECVRRTHRKAWDVGLVILPRSVFSRLGFQRGDTSLQSCGGGTDGIQLPAEALGLLEAPDEL